MEKVVNYITTVNGSPSEVGYPTIARDWQVHKHLEAIIIL